MGKEMSKDNHKYTDEELIARFQNGDEYAFDEIVHRYKDRLLNFIFRFLGQMDEAEDIVQDTFLKVYKNKNAYENIARFSTWIYTIAGNLAKTELRKRKRRRMFSISGKGIDEKEYELRSGDRTPEEETDSVFNEKIIQGAIEKLHEKFRTVIILRDIQELSYDEISNIIGVPLGTVKSRVNRARLKLQEMLKDIR